MRFNFDAVRARHLVNKAEEIQRGIFMEPVTPQRKKSAICHASNDGDRPWHETIRFSAATNEQFTGSRMKCTEYPAAPVRKGNGGFMNRPWFRAAFFLATRRDHDQYAQFRPLIWIRSRPPIEPIGHP